MEHPLLQYYNALDALVKKGQCPQIHDDASFIKYYIKYLSFQDKIHLDRYNVINKSELKNAIFHYLGMSSPKNDDLLQSDQPDEPKQQACDLPRQQACQQDAPKTLCQPTAQSVCDSPPKPVKTVNTVSETYFVQNGQPAYSFRYTPQQSIEEDTLQRKENSCEETHNADSEEEDQMSVYSNYIVVEVKNVTYVALIKSGSNVSYVNESIVNKLGTLHVNNHKLIHSLKTVNLNLIIDNAVCPVICEVKKLKDGIDLVLGNDFLSEYRAEIDFQKHTLALNRRFKTTLLTEDQMSEWKRQSEEDENDSKKNEEDSQRKDDENEERKISDIRIEDHVNVKKMTIEENLEMTSNVKEDEKMLSKSDLSSEKEELVQQNKKEENIQNQKVSEVVQKENLPTRELSEEITSVKKYTIKIQERFTNSDKKETGSSQSTMTMAIQHEHTILHNIRIYGQMPEVHNYKTRKKIPAAAA